MKYQFSFLKILTKPDLLGLMSSNSKKIQSTRSIIGNPILQGGKLPQCVSVTIVAHAIQFQQSIKNSLHHNTFLPEAVKADVTLQHHLTELKVAQHQSMHLSTQSNKISTDATIHFMLHDFMLYRCTPRIRPGATTVFCIYVSFVNHRQILPGLSAAICR